MENILPLGPVPTPTRSVPVLSSQRLEILDLLAGRADACSVDQLAVAAGLHPNTVRSHLDGLVEAGLASRTAERTGRRGRPSWRYRAVRERIEGAPEYVGLAIALAEQIAAGSDDPSAVARAAGERWADGLPGTGRGALQVVSLLDDLGFAPRPDGRDIRLTACPVLTAARRNPEVVCAMHEGLIRARSAPGAPGSLEPFAGPGYCTWHGHD